MGQKAALGAAAVYHQNAPQKCPGLLAGAAGPHASASALASPSSARLLGLVGVLHLLEALEALRLGLAGDKLRDAPPPILHILAHHLERLDQRKLLLLAPLPAAAAIGGGGGGSGSWRWRRRGRRCFCCWRAGSRRRGGCPRLQQLRRVAL